MEPRCWIQSSINHTCFKASSTQRGEPKEETKALRKTTEAKKSAVIPGSSGAPPLGSQTKRIPSGGSNTSVQLNAPARSTLVAPVVSVASTGIWKSPTPSFNPPISSAAANPRSSTIAGHGQSNNRGGSLVGFSSLGTKTRLSANSSHVSSTGAKSNIGTSAANLQKHTASIPRLRTSSTLMAPTASSLAKTNSHSRIPVSTASHSENSTFTKASTSSKQRFAMSPQPSATLEQITNSPRSPAHSPRPAKIFSQPLSPPPTHPPMSLTTAATSIVGQATKERSSSSLKPPIPPKTKVLPGRRPRISRSKVIARLASQRAAGSGSSASAGTERAGGKVRSSMGAEVAGKARPSYGSARGGDMMISVKKRVRQSEHARRKSRTIAGEGRKMDVD